MPSCAAWSLPRLPRPCGAGLQETLEAPPSEEEVALAKAQVPFFTVTAFHVTLKSRSNVPPRVVPVEPAIRLLGPQHHARQAPFPPFGEARAAQASELVPNTQFTGGLTGAPGPQTINSFVFNFASSSAQLQRRLVYSLVGLPQVRLKGFGALRP